MKAEFDENGTLVISAESVIEGMAMKLWQQKWEAKQSVLRTVSYTIKNADDTNFRDIVGPLL